MESKPHLSARETRILLNYGLAVTALVFLLLFLGWIRAGFPTKAADPYHAQIAVLVPLTGENAEYGRKLFDIVSATKNYVISQRNLKQWNITVIGYNIGNTPASAAWAAYKATRNPNTVAIIGPLDARQVIAIKNTLGSKQLPIITVASTVPNLAVSSKEGVYRIPSTDDLQGPAIVDFLQSRGKTNIVLIVESNAYTKKVLSSMEKAASNRLRFILSLETKPSDTGIDALKLISPDKADAIVYLGGNKGLALIIKTLQTTKLNLPIIGLDSINDIQNSKLLTNGQELFFTSPISVSSNVLGAYSFYTKGKFQPYFIESIQATWLVLNALSSTNNEALGRNIVWQNLSRATVTGPGGENRIWNNGQLFPSTIYIYHGTKDASNWFYGPVSTINP